MELRQETEVEHRADNRATSPSLFYLFFIQSNRRIMKRRSAQKGSVCESKLRGKCVCCVDQANRRNESEHRDPKDEVEMMSERVANVTVSVITSMSQSNASRVRGN